MGLNDNREGACLARQAGFIGSVKAVLADLVDTDHRRLNSRNLADLDRRVSGRLRADDLDEAAAARGPGPDPIGGGRTLASSARWARGGRPG